jgi:hypothetical protein
MADGSLDRARQELIYAPIKFHAVIGFWSESAREFTFEMRGTKPTGEPLKGTGEPAQVRISAPEDGGYTLNLMATVASSISGIYWFEFLADGEVLLKLPMLIRHESESPDPTNETQAGS